MSELDISVQSALDEYFKLKVKYENEIRSNKKKIINNTTLSNKEKRAEFMKLKPKCINCKRPGGTRFNILFQPETDKDESYREYSARCGIVADPCNLEVKIRIGKTELLNNVLNTLQDDIKISKNEVINDKNKLLFGYITTETALDNFDSSKEYISEITSLYEQYLRLYNDVVDNSEKKHELDEALVQAYLLIDQMKQSIKQYNETDKVQYAQDVATLYDKNLHPLLIKIRNLKYATNIVFYDEDNNTYNLIQNKYSVKNLEHSSYKSNVVAFDVGLKINKKKRVIIETQAVEQMPILQRDEPIYGQGAHGIAWNNPEYQKLWDRLPLKLKNVLRPDREWMIDFMYTCLSDRLKPGFNGCKLPAPRDLKLPPVKNQNGKYDFGVKIYNDVFNAFSETLKETYLKMYKEEEGIKNYDMLSNAITDAVAKEVDLGRGFL